MSLFYIYPGVKLNLFSRMLQMVEAVYIGLSYIYPGIKPNLLFTNR